MDVSGICVGLEQAVEEVSKPRQMMLGLPLF